MNINNNSRKKFHILGLLVCCVAIATMILIVIFPTTSVDSKSSSSLSPSKTQSSHASDDTISSHSSRSDIGTSSSTSNNELNPKRSTGQLPASNVVTNSNNEVDGSANINNNTGSSKLLILSFDDNRKGDSTYAKPILDKYGFKASFFIICNKTTDKGAMNWNDIAAMKQDGMDIESHTMTHPHLSTLSQSQLDFEIGGSKQCLATHGYNATIFAYPYDDGSDDPTVVNTVAKYYDMARSGTAPLMFLNCNGVEKHPQTDCRTYSPSGKLNYANRYDIRSFTENLMEQRDSFDTTKTMIDFANMVNNQTSYNKNGAIKAIPLVTYHNVGFDTNAPYSTTVSLFDQEMKYLHDNGFKVLTMKDLGYNTQTNTFYLK
jgi:peptidoglycan/xylan/chitin deacetylase (PgdA/CDA1 family)